MYNGHGHDVTASGGAQAAFNGQEAHIQTAPPPGFLVDRLTDRLKHYVDIDSERNEFIRNILKSFESAEEEIRVLKLDLQAEKFTRANFQGEVHSLSKTVDRLEKKINKDAYVVVLVDGDGAKFADNFLQDRANGAERAAAALKASVRDALKNSPLDSDDLSILVRVYANLNGLANSLKMSHVIRSDEEMRDFAESFTNSRPEFDFVNVGRGKENADSKMRRMLNHFHRNTSCKKIFLAGCCHDNGYLHDLRQYSGDPEQRLVLVETTTAEPGFRSLGFPIVQFNGVFRSHPLNNESKRMYAGLQPLPPPQTLPSPGPIQPPSSVSASAQAPITSPILTDQRRNMTPSTVSSDSPIMTHSATAATASEAHPNRSPSVITSKNGGTSVSYATAGGNAEHQNITVKPALAKGKRQPRTIDYNIDGIRIDPPISHPGNSPAQLSYKKKVDAAKRAHNVLCNDFYLAGRCPHGDSCDKIHNVDMTPSELAIHRYKARTSPCPRTPDCAVYGCYLSHQCPFGGDCTRGDCKFRNWGRWGDLHMTEEGLVPATRWTEGSDFPQDLAK